MENIIERDPRRWQILKETEKEVIFSAGNWANVGGEDKPITIRALKTGDVYKMWKAEMERVEAGGPVVELEEGVVITPVWRQFGPATEAHVEVVPPVPEEHQGKKLLALEARKERAGIEWRLEGLRAQLRAMPYCDHEKDYCSGECKLREELIALEKQLLGDP